MQESISKMTTKGGLLKAGVLIAFVFLSGCGDRGWPTVEWENRSDEAIWVDVKGVTPDPSVGVLGAGVGTHKLSGASLEFGGPVRFKDTITIEWRAKEGGNERSQELKRSDLKLPATVLGGEIRFIYSAEGEWTIKRK